MRVIGILVGLFVIAAGTADAGTRIVVMTGARGEDAAALRVALAGRGTEIAELPAPAGGLRLDRAANAQRAALDAQAEAGVWIEIEPGGAEVCVVSADGKLFRRAPLPLDAGSPRVFAAIAASLLDEVLHPMPDPIPDITVDVHVDIGGGHAPAQPQVAVAPGVATQWAAPGAIAPIAIAAPMTGVVRAHRTLLELGPMLSPFSAGLEVELAFPVTERLRFGAVGAINSLLFTDTPHGVFVGALELRRVGRGMAHNDLGFVAGAAYVTAEAGVTVPMFGVRLQRKWEMENTAISLSLVPVVAFLEGKPFPGIYSSLRWDLPI